MTIGNILELLEAKVVTENVNEAFEVSSGFVGDLLSVVMGKAEEDCAWMTIQGHLNIVGVGALVGVGCIIVTEGFNVDQDAVTKANEEEITIITTKLSSYQACALLAKNGLE